MLRPPNPRALTALVQGLPLRRVRAVLGAIAGLALLVGVIIGTGLPGSSQGANQPKTSGGATVQRRDLVATDTQSGTLSYASPQTVYNRVSGTVTWLPAVGAVVQPGQTLYKVDNSPVMLFDGAVPAYRDLTSSDTSGPDIQELNQNLVKLGFDPTHEITINDAWQTGTTDAINRWQSALGQTQTGTITFGQVVFLPGTQRITAVNTVLGSNGAASSGSGTGSSSATGASGSYAPRSQFVSLTTPVVNTTTTTTSASPSTFSASASPSSPTSTCTTTTTDSAGAASAQTCKTTGSGQNSSSTLSLKALLALLKAETKELNSSSRAGSGTSGLSATGGGGASAGSSGGSSGSSGSGGGSGAAASGSGAAASGSSGASSATAILSTTSTREVVTVSLDATKQTEAVVGEPVTVQLPDGSVADGRITKVSPVAQTSSSSSGSGTGAGGSSSTPTATIPVTISLTGHRKVAGLDQAAVSVNFQQQKATNVLSVPVTALLATAGGGYAVQEAAPPRTLLPVTPGLFAAGYVQISGSNIYDGLQVTDSQG